MGKMGISEGTRKEDAAAIFDMARQYLNPGRFFRYVTYLYAQRKELVFLAIHIVSTLVVWSKCNKQSLLPF